MSNLLIFVHFFLFFPGGNILFPECLLYFFRIQVLYQCILTYRLPRIPWVRSHIASAINSQADFRWTWLLPVRADLFEVRGKILSTPWALPIHGLVVSKLPRECHHWQVQFLSLIIIKYIFTYYIIYLILNN